MTRHFAQQWKLRVMAQGVALKEIAKAALRRLLAYNKSSSYADLKVGESVLFYKASDRESAPGWRGPALIPDFDDAGVRVKFQTRTSTVSRYCVRMRVDTKDAPKRVDTEEESESGLGEVGYLGLSAVGGAGRRTWRLSVVYGAGEGFY